MEAHNTTIDTFSQTTVTSNTQGDNKNLILTSEKQNTSDAPAEKIKGLTINDTGYYESDRVNANDAKGYPERDPKIVTHTSDGKKIKVTDTSNGDLHQTLLINRTLPIITTMMDPPVDDSIETCSGTPHTLATTLTKEFITDAAYSSPRFLRTPRNVRRTCRGITDPGENIYAVRSPGITNQF